MTVSGALGFGRAGSSLSLLGGEAAGGMTPPAVGHGDPPGGELGSGGLGDGALSVSQIFKGLNDGGPWESQVLALRDRLQTVARAAERTEEARANQVRHSQIYNPFAPDVAREHVTCSHPWDALCIHGACPLPTQRFLASSAFIPSTLLHRHGSTRQSSSERKKKSVSRGPRASGCGKC